MPTPFNPNLHLKQGVSEVAQIQSIVQRLHDKMQRDAIVQDTTDSLRDFLKVDRVVLYYFYRQWEGRVTFESLSDQRFSILGSTGPDECFNGEYAAMYLAGRVRAIANIETEPLAPCHREFLQDMRVRANLVVPILTEKGLWGLLVAHHCQSPRPWTDAEIAQMNQGALTLASAPSIKDN